MSSANTVTPGSPGFDLGRIPPAVSIAVAIAIWALLYLPAFSFKVSDFNNFLQPWLDYLRANGGFAALKDDFSEYAPPYLYLLAAASYFDFPFSDPALIKVINAPFVLLFAVTIFFTCRHFGKSVNVAAAAGASAFVLPTLSLNAFVWGQADALYASLLTLAVMLVLKRKPYWAFAIFSASLCIKLQSLFLAPFMLMMVFAGRIPWKAMLLGPVVYIASILPAALIGRPINELLTVYLVQGRFYNQLSLNAANPYFPLEFFFKISSNWQIYKYFAAFGLLFAAGVGALISAIGVARREMSDRAVLIAAGLSVSVMPYVLPKMHDRYFIVADLLTFALAWVDRRFIWAAVAMQISSALSYGPEFARYGLPGTIEGWQWGVVAGVLINGAVIVMLAKALIEELGGLWDIAAIKKLSPIRLA